MRITAAAIAASIDRTGRSARRVAPWLLLVVLVAQAVAFVARAAFGLSLAGFVAAAPAANTAMVFLTAAILVVRRYPSARAPRAANATRRDRLGPAATAVLAAFGAAALFVLAVHDLIVRAPGAGDDVDFAAAVGDAVIRLMLLVFAGLLFAHAVAAGLRIAVAVRTRRPTAAAAAPRRR